MDSSQTAGASSGAAALSPKHFLAQPRPSVAPTKDDSFFETDVDLSSSSSSSSSLRNIYGVTSSSVSSSPRQAHRRSTVDTSTVAAHDFDVDDRTGFMPPDPPLERLPRQYEAWESILEEAVRSKLQLGGKKGLTKDEMSLSEAWREKVKKLPIITTDDLTSSEHLLRRAHHVLAWIMHFFINTLQLTAPIIIPPPISIPIIRVSTQLALPPILTYSDDVLYNWRYKDTTAEDIQHQKQVECDPLIPQFEAFSMDSSPAIIPRVGQITSLTTFTSTVSETAFYLASAHCELIGALSLKYMSNILDEAFVLDTLALRRISHYLLLLSKSIDDVREELDRVKIDCDPDAFYWEIRPWFKGCDSMEGGRKWIFDGVGEFAESVRDEEQYEEYKKLRQPRLDELSGPSAAQSSLVHVLDIFLGVEQFSHKQTSDGASPSKSSGGDTFLKRMQTYMPRHHRSFLSHISTKTPHIPIRTLIETYDPQHPEFALKENYNKAVDALTRFRDAHIKIVALYIIGPARRVKAGERVAELPSTSSEKEAKVESKDETKKANLKGTGGTNLVPFLKGVRDLTASAVLS